ncbi:MAG: hypothetical protein LC750_04525 [Actinobacteria bacterium]|nr:hypothetical protein [Actinomycetota bacterium]
MAERKTEIAFIISYANPVKRMRKQAPFDTTFDKMLAKLDEPLEHPQKVLHQSAD